MLTTGDWFRYLEDRREKTTVETYRVLMSGYAKTFGKHLNKMTIEDFRPIEVEERMNAYNAPRSANTLLATVKSFVKWARVNENILDIGTLLRTDNMARGVSAIEFRKVPRAMKSEALTVDSLRLLLSAMESDDLLRAATITHFYLGARPVELSSKFKAKGIDPANADIENAIDYENNLISIVTAKTNRTRFRLLPYPPEIEDELRTWVNWTRKLDGYTYKRQWYTKALKPYNKRLGMKVSAKTARKTVMTQMSAGGVQQWIISYMLGHTEQISGEYRDKTVLLGMIYKEALEHHFILEAI